MPMPCVICLDPAKAQRAAELIAAGLSDGKVAAALGGASRAGVQRHRQNHIFKPARDRLAVIGKGTQGRQQLQQLAQAAAAGTPSPQAIVDAMFGLQASAQKIADVQDRLERMATLAEAGKSAGGVAQLAAQQIRSIEVGAKLAGTGGYAPRAAMDGAAAQSFSVTINLGDETISISTPLPSAPVFDHNEGDGFDADAARSCGKRFSNG